MWIDGFISFFVWCVECVSMDDRATILWITFCALFPHFPFFYIYFHVELIDFHANLQFYLNIIMISTFIIIVRNSWTSKSMNNIKRKNIQNPSSTQFLQLKHCNSQWLKCRQLKIHNSYLIHHQKRTILILKFLIPKITKRKKTFAVVKPLCISMQWTKYNNEK